MKVAACTVSDYTNINRENIRRRLAYLAILLNKAKLQNTNLVLMPGGYFLVEVTSPGAFDYVPVEVAQLGAEIQILSNYFAIAIVVGVDVYTSEDDASKKYQLWQYDQHNKELLTGTFPCFAIAATSNLINSSKKPEIWRQRSQWGRTWRSFYPGGKRIPCDDVRRVRLEMRDPLSPYYHEARTVWGTFSDRRTIEVGERAFEVLICGEAHNRIIKDAIVKNKKRNEMPFAVLDCAHQAGGGLRIHKAGDFFAEKHIRFFCSVHVNKQAGTKYGFRYRRSYKKVPKDRFWDYRTNDMFGLKLQEPRIEVGTWSIQ